MAAMSVAIAAPPSRAEARAAQGMTALERQRLLAHLEMTSSWLLDEVANLSREQLHFRPSPGAWTIMQVLDHLVVVAPVYWQDLQRSLEQPATGPASQMTDADVLWYGIDRTRRETARPAETPTGTIGSLQELLGAYRAHHARLVDYIETTTDDLRGHIVARQGCDAYQWALLISTHEQRHVLQIREIKAHPRYPR